MRVGPDLLNLVVQGDRVAAGQLVEGVWPDAYRIALTVTRTPQIAEDTAQEACIEMLASLPRLKEPAAFPAWFYRLVIRTAYRELKRFGREQLSEAMPETPSNSVGRKEIKEALDGIQRTERLALILHYYYGFSSIEIASITGSTAGTVRYRLWRAKRQLKALLLEP